MLCSTRQPTVLKLNQCVVGLLNHLAYARFPWASIPNHSANVTTISDDCSLFRSPTYPSLSTTARNHFLCSWSTDLAGTYAPHRILHRGKTDMWASRWAIHVWDIHRFWGFIRKGVLRASCRWLHSLFDLLPVFPRILGLFWEGNHVGNSDWKWSWRLSSRISFAGRVISVLVWQKARQKRKQARTEAGFESMSVNNKNRQSSNGSRHRRPITLWSICV